ncbi:alcohol dehydrogenase catalytic domain-containing protein [Acidobacteriia bacterium AH_259_A11_L15]|nr:alcohol dehydrogenase catalytic domain-containing protein [Acidobacteriia bacterium AH_259_A11_L15]
MKAVVLHEFGPAENLHVEELSEPRPGPHEILLRVGACGVCFHDVINRQGNLPRTRLPAILGHEVAGEVLEVGPEVTHFRPTDRVACLQRVNCGHCQYCRDSRPTLCRTGAVFFGEEIPGGYAEYFVAPEHVLAKIPDSLSNAEAAVTACTLGTAVHALGRRARLQPGQTVLITGASGGVGVHAIQLARLLGAQVVAVTSSESKLDRLRQLGATVAIHAPRLEFAKAVKAAVGSVDIALEVVGSATLDESLHTLKSGGTLVVLGNVVGGQAAFNPGLVILKELEVIGSFATSVAELEESFELVASGKIRVVVSQCLPLQEAVEAHHLLEARAVTGRLVLQP